MYCGPEMHINAILLVKSYTVCLYSVSIEKWACICHIILVRLHFKIYWMKCIRFIFANETAPNKTAYSREQKRYLNNRFWWPHLWIIIIHAMRNQHTRPIQFLNASTWTIYLLCRPPLQLSNSLFSCQFDA